MTTSTWRKRPNETLAFEMDFAADLASGESVNGVSDWTAEVYQGTDASPGDLISGNAVQSGSKSQQMITGGLEGVTYKLIAQVTTDGGETLEACNLISVSEQC